jgi:hypothetical protein
MRRWFRVGTATAADPWRAGYDAASAALAGPDPRLLLAFGAGLREPKAVAAGIRKAAGRVPLAGCSSRTSIGPDGPSQHGVVVVALGGPGFSVATAAETGATTSPREIGATVAGCVDELDGRPYRVLIVLADGLAAGQEEIIAGVYGIVGASVPLVGGSACSDPAYGRTYLMHGDEVLEDAVLAVAIGSDAPFGVGLSHGWRKVGDPMIITSAVGGDIYTLDDQPALAAYLRRLGAPPAAYTDAVAFETFAQSHPVGLRRRSGEDLRTVSDSTRFVDGWLRSNGDLPEGGVVWLLEGDADSMLEASEEACRVALDALGSPPLGCLAFNCESRMGLLGDEGVRHEVERMNRQAGVPVAGLYSWGEIARTRGIGGFHHHVLVVLAVG